MLKYFIKETDNTKHKEGCAITSRSKDWYAQWIPANECPGCGTPAVISEEKVIDEEVQVPFVRIKSNTDANI